MSEDVRARVLELVRAHGWNATAFQTLERDYAYAFYGDACVAYVETAGARVAAGAPIAAEAELASVAAAFVRDARAVGKRCCFVATEDRFCRATRDELRTLAIGEQPVWDPRGWAAHLRTHRSLREQLRRARAKGVRVRLLEPRELDDGAVRDAIEGIVARWLASRELAPLEFLVRVDPFTFPTDRRCFVAELGDAIVGFAAAIPVPARAGWFIEDLLRDADAPNGTTESLVDAVMRWAEQSGCEWLTLGLAPLSGEVRGFLRLARERGGIVYDFEGLHAFKAKLGPHTWLPLHLSYPPTQRAITSVVDTLVAFAGGRPLRFLLRSLVRGPTAVIRLFALLLVPWTILLALAPAEPWFGGPLAKWPWVGFDVLLLVALFRVLHRRSSRLLRAIAIAISADAIVTLAHAIAWHAGRPHGPIAIVLIAIACIAPASAAVVMWGAARRGSSSAP